MPCPHTHNSHVLNDIFPDCCGYCRKLCDQLEQIHFNLSNEFWPNRTFWAGSPCHAHTFWTGHVTYKEPCEPDLCQEIVGLTFVRIPSSRWFFCRTCCRASWIFCCSFSIFTFSCSHERSKHEKTKLSVLPSPLHQTLVPPDQNTGYCVIVCVHRLPGQFPSLKLCFCRLQRQSLISRAGYERSPLQLVLGWREAALLLKTSYIRARPQWLHMNPQCPTLPKLSW